jgi:thiol-disulfide isomerase/thioredoxin
MWGAIRMIVSWLNPISTRRRIVLIRRRKTGMCNSRLAYCLLALAIFSLAGCSQIGSLRSNHPSNLKTVASVGDKPLPIVASGESNSSPAAETESLDLPRSTGSRISGRVFDDRGKPVPNAKVRLVVGGMPAGRDNFATTDRSGAFTLRDLRAGRTYTLIAECQGEDEMMSGRAEARVPQSDVRIDVVAHNPSNGSESRPVTIHPARSRTVPPSDADRDEEEEFPPSIKPGANRIEDEESEQPAEEAASLAPRTNRQSAARLATAATSGPIRAGWNVTQRPSSSKARAAVPTRGQAAEVDSRPRRTTNEATGGEPDDGENPLPPAIDSEGAASDESVGRDEPVRLDRSRDDSLLARSRTGTRRIPDRSLAEDDGEPRPIPNEVGAAGRSIEPASYGRKEPSEPDGDGDGDGDVARSSRTGQRPRRGAPSASSKASRSHALPAPSGPVDTMEPTDGETAEPSSQPQRRPTWRELSLAPNDVPVDESVRRTSGEEPALDPDVVKTAGGFDSTDEPRHDTSKPGGARTPSKTAAPADRGSSHRATGESTCQIDPAHRRIIDFQLPGLDGKMVSFRDIDADVIVIDFWGSWCLQCRKSIAYERELLEKLGRKRVQVIGIACEKGATLEARRASAAGAGRRLGITYPVLVSSMDGSCPLQKAFQVQFYPTLVVVDREGRILHIAQGATDATLGRTDRFIASALRDAGSRTE